MRCFSIVTLAFFSINAQTVIFEQTGPARDTQISLPGLTSGDLYSLQVSVDQPAALQGKPLKVELSSVASKTLHEGDGDLYIRARARAQAPQITIQGTAPTSLKVVAVRLTPDTITEFEPNNRWQDANPLILGSLISGSADDLPYIPAPGTKPSLGQDQDWFRFTFNEDTPRLVFFQVELKDRDNIPTDVSIFRVVNGKEIPYVEGEDPVSLPHEVQALAANKFTTRVLREKGDYYVRVTANHPNYKLRTRVYDLPPYSEPQKAVRTAVDYLLGAGDGWHGNTPRRGGLWERVSNVHQETSLCVSCHPTHFTQRAALYALRNGYPVHQKEQLRFLTERFYNNPRPLPGYEEDGAVWARVISAAANVLGRMSHLMDVYEKELSKEPRQEFHDGIRKFLKLYYQDRDKLPPDETNGNQPLVSAYEVAWYAWEVTRDPAIENLLNQDHGIRNMIDLCYQTQALSAIDPEKYAEKISANVKRLLSLQREDGQWSMHFNPKEKEVEFQTGHVLWALHGAGISKDNPQVKKGLEYLLSRQQEFGGWMDPLQSFENFRTPFRETQMAVLALSAYYPGPGKETWNEEPDRNNLKSPDALVRAETLEALAAAAKPTDLPLALTAMDDPSKLVQRAAAFLTRQILVRNTTEENRKLFAPLLTAKSERARWAATRVFASHFANLAARPAYLDSLKPLLNDSSPTVRMQAVKGLQTGYHWSSSNAQRGEIEKAFLTALKAHQHPWVEQNLREGIYNLTDENIRYLYNNWVPTISRKKDQDKVVAGRLAAEARQAELFSTFLIQENDTARKKLLKALVEFPLRRADIYDPKADHSAPVNPPPYNRIGNDIEQIVFFGDSASKMTKALAPLVDSTDPELKRLARGAVQMVRDANFAAPVAMAGPSIAERKDLIAKVTPPPPPKPAQAPGAKAVAVTTSTNDKPDDSYFRGYVQPILETRGKDGYACVHCHASHAIFDGTLAGAKRVIDTENPEASLILRKPISTAESEGTLDAQTAGGKLSHGGGIRWEPNSPEYNTILNWIKGAKP